MAFTTRLTITCFNCRRPRKSTAPSGKIPDQPDPSFSSGVRTIEGFGDRIVEIDLDLEGRRLPGKEKEFSLLFHVRKWMPG